MPMLGSDNSRSYKWLKPANAIEDALFVDGCVAGFPAFWP